MKTFKYYAKLFFPKLKILFLFYALIFTGITAYAQNANGTITVPTEEVRNLDINIHAETNISGNPVTYDLPTQTDTATPYSFQVQTLGTDIFDLNESIEVINSSEINVIGNFGSESKAELYALSGQRILSTTNNSLEKITSKDGRQQFFHDGSKLTPGIYALQVRGDINTNMKIAVTTTAGDGRPDYFGFEPQLKSTAFAPQIYNLTVTGDEVFTLTQDISIIEGENGNFITNTIIPADGDVGLRAQYQSSTVEAIFNFVRESDPTIQYNFNSADFANNIIPVENLPVSTQDTPEPYSGTIVSPDGSFPDTPISFTIVNDVNGNQNGLKTFQADNLDQNQTVNLNVRDYLTLDSLEGMTVEYVDDDGDGDYTNDAVLATATTNSTGTASATLPANEDFYIRTSGTDVDGVVYYTKTNGTLSTPTSIDNISQQSATYNTVAVAKFNDENGVPVPASILTEYKPQADNTEFILGHWNVYFPPSPNRDTYIARFNTVATLLGKPGAVIDHDTPFPDPTTNGTDVTYQAYNDEGQRQVHTGLIGANIDDYIGTESGLGTKFISSQTSQELITYYTTTFELGGLDFSATDHEIGNALGFPLRVSTTMYPTSRDPLASNNVSIDNSAIDKACMPVWIQLGTHHYETNTTIEYSMADKFEE